MPLGAGARDRRSQPEPGEEQFAEQFDLGRAQRPVPLIAAYDGGGETPGVGRLLVSGIADHRGESAGEVADGGRVVHVAEVDKPRHLVGGRPAR